MSFFKRFKKNKPTEAYTITTIPDKPEPKPEFKTVEGDAPKTASHVITGDDVRDT